MQTVCEINNELKASLNFEFEEESNIKQETKQSSLP